MRGLFPNYEGLKPLISQCLTYTMLDSNTLNGHTYEELHTCTSTLTQLHGWLVMTVTHLLGFSLLVCDCKTLGTYYTLPPCALSFKKVIVAIEVSYQPFP